VLDADARAKGCFRSLSAKDGSTLLELRPPPEQELGEAPAEGR
jgi:hypothetical protein